MQGHVCTNILLNLMMNFNLKKNFIFLYFMSTKLRNKSFYTYFQKRQILGCYKPLNMATGNIRMDSGFARPRPREKSHARTRACHPPWATTYARARAHGHRLMPVSAPIGLGAHGYTGFFSARCHL